MSNAGVSAMPIIEGLASAGLNDQRAWTRFAFEKPLGPGGWEQR